MPDLDPVFERLAAMLREHAEGLVATRDDADQLYLETSQDPAEFFGAVMRKKAQVAYHLMPVYRDPGLLADLGPALRKRMQGKSCFNFTRVDDDLFAVGQGNDVVAIPVPPADRHRDVGQVEAPWSGEKD